MGFRASITASCSLILTLALLGSGCAKKVRFKALPLAGRGTAAAVVNLTYDRNNILEVKLSNVPDPAAIKAGYTRYVLWAATEDREHAVNIGQLRVDEKKNAAIKTLTPLRSFILFITAEPAGDVTSPGPDTVFEAPLTKW